MSPMQLVFILVAGVTLGAGMMVVTTRNMVHAALWLVLALFGVAVTYVLLNAGFLGIVQVVIYIGAIAILFIFAVMLTRQVMKDSGPQSNSNWWLAGIVCVGLFGGLVWVLSSWHGFSSFPPMLDTEAETLVELGKALVSPNAYVLPFELASILLVAALIGAIYVAWGKK